MPPLEEHEYYEALGLTPPEPEDDEPTPEEQPDETGETPSPEVDEDAPEDEQPPAEAEEQSPPEEPPADDAPTAEQMRIDAAVQAALEAERQKTNQRLSAFFAKAGLRNPMDGNKPIESLEAFEAYQQAYDAQQLQRRLKAGQLTPEDLQAAIAATPEMQRLRQQEQERQAQEQAAQQAAQKAQIDAELAEIGKLDPTVKSLEDILRQETGKEFAAKVRQGYSFLDAFRLANYQRLMDGAAAAAREKETLARSKEHLAPHGKGKGQGAPSVPAEVSQMYDALIPGMTAEEKQKHWARYKGK